MIVYGVTPAGFVHKPMDVIMSEIDAGLLGILGKSAGTEPDGSIPLQSKAGQLKTWLTDGFSAAWDLQQAVYSAFNPNTAIGASEDQVCAITGTTRLPQQFSTVIGTCTGTPGTALQPGRVASVTSTGSRFDTLAAAVIAAVPAWVALTGYLIGARVTNAGNIYVCTVAGVSAGAGGPTGTGGAIVDATCTWKFVGIGTGAIDVTFEAELPGPIGALAGALATIQTPVSGWRSVVNLLDAAQGQLLELDSTLRVRRDAELSADGRSVPDAIRAIVLKVGEGTNNPVTACRVFYNDTDLVDANGLPPHSVEVVVFGGPDDTLVPGDTSKLEASVAAAVFGSVGAGIKSYGTTAVAVGDSAGNVHTVRFTRPAPVPIYVTLQVAYNPLLWPLTGAAALVEAAALSAILTYTRTRQIPGESVRALELSAEVKLGPSATDTTGAAVIPAPPGSPPAPGIVDVPALTLGTAPFPVTSTPVAITPFQIATFDSSRIIITAIPEAP